MKVICAADDLTVATRTAYINAVSVKQVWGKCVLGENLLETVDQHSQADAPKLSVESFNGNVPETEPNYAQSKSEEQAGAKIVEGEGLLATVDYHSQADAQALSVVSFNGHVPETEPNYAQSKSEEQAGAKIVEGVVVQDQERGM